MPFMSSVAGLSLRAFGFAWGALNSVFDNWVSSTPRSLGNATSGQAWTVVQGAWTASGGGTAVTSTSPSSYPFATVALNQNVQSSIQNAQPGSGLVFWETGAGDWWASIVNATTALVATGTQPYYSSCCTGSNTCVGCGPSYTCPNGQFVGGTSCYEYVGSDVRLVGPATYVPYNPCCTGSNTCTQPPICGYTTTYTTFYYWGISIIQSVASAISTVANATLNAVTTTATQIQSLSLTVIGGNIATQAYSDATLTTPYGSVLTATGTPGGTNVGIIVAPATQGSASGGSAYLQGNSAGQFSAH